MQELQAIVRGRVQLVMFRDFTKRRARRLGLRGYVQNLKDGTVRVVAQGERAALETLISALHRGSFLSRVDSVEATWRPSGQEYKGFNIRF